MIGLIGAFFKLMFSPSYHSIDITVEDPLKKLKWNIFFNEKDRIFFYSFRLFVGKKISHSFSKAIKDLKKKS